MLTVSVRKRRDAFELDARFAMPTPGIVALFGRSGCGKSTLVNIMAGLLSPTPAPSQLDDEVLLDTAQRHRRPGGEAPHRLRFPGLPGCFPI